MGAHDSLVTLSARCVIFVHCHQCWGVAARITHIPTSNPSKLTASSAELGWSPCFSFCWTLSPVKRRAGKTAQCACHKCRFSEFNSPHSHGGRREVTHKLWSDLCTQAACVPLHLPPTCPASPAPHIHKGRTRRKTVWIAERCHG